MNDKKNPKNPPNYNCENCNYKTQSSKDFNKHLLTAKHIKMTNDDIKSQKIPEDFICECGKRYKYRQGLFSHKKGCSIDINSKPFIEPIINTNMFLELINQNKELQQLLVQQSKENSELVNRLIEREPSNNTINNTTNNNQKFNLNFFLNETCKDAMNIQEFIENIKVTFEDLLTIGNDGFVNGLSDIFIKQLKDLEVEKRPIHCTDSKRETIYLKANDAWEKDDKENKKLKDVIEKVEYKNVAALHQWCSENPDSKINNTPNNLLRDKIFLQTLQGDDKSREKIVKNISREIVIDKT